MTVSRATLIAAYPEFGGISSDLVDAKIADAELEVDLDHWGDDADRGVMLYAAKLLALTPFGMEMGLGPKGNEPSVYASEFTRLNRRKGNLRR